LFILITVHLHAICQNDSIGVAYLTDDIPSSVAGMSDVLYYSGWNDQRLVIHSIRKQKDGTYILKYPRTYDTYKGVKGTFNSYVDFVTPTPLPKQIRDLSNIASEPKDFFRTAVSFGNDLQLLLPGGRTGFYTLDLGHNRYNSIVPDSYMDRYKAGLKLSTIHINHFETDIDFRYTHDDGRFTGRGDGLSWLMYPVYTGTNRETIDHLKEQNRDTQRTDYLSGHAVTKREWSDLKTKASLSYQRQWDKWNRNLYNHPSFSHLRRYEDTSDLLFSTEGELQQEHYYSSYVKWYFKVKYDFRASTSHLERNYDKQGFDFKERLTRNAHDITYQARLTNSYWDVRIANKHYISNTLKGDIRYHLLPEIQVQWEDYDHVVSDFLGGYRYDSFFISGNVSRSVGEAPLIYRNQGALSTIYASNDFNRYVYDRELFSHNNLKAKEYLNTDLSMRYVTGYGGFTLDVRGFYNSTRNFTSPVFESNNQEFSLRNIGRTHNYGYQLEAFWVTRINRNTILDINWQFSRSWNKVASSYRDEPFVKLAGFTDVASVFAQGETVGAIYGTTYMRGEDGTLLKDIQGNPLVDSSLKKIGDPTPDFVTALRSSLGYRDIKLIAVFEYSQGGDRWNGTEAFLTNYTGTNTFTSAYGAGEDYIQKATWFRLAELSVIWHLPFRINYKTPRLGFAGRNLFMLTPYKGIDPSTVLYGNQTTRGLDLFNQPTSRQFTISLTIEL